jgi:transposase-like protein
MKQASTTITAMTCTPCDVRCQRFGVHRNGLQRFRCPNCKKTYTEEHKHLIADMNLADEKALLALQLFVEGNSLRSTERITGVDINTADEALGSRWREVREGHGKADCQHPGEGRSV